MPTNQFFCLWIWSRFVKSNRELSSYWLDALHVNILKLKRKTFRNTWKRWAGGKFNPLLIHSLPNQFFWIQGGKRLSLYKSHYGALSQQLPFPGHLGTDQNTSYHWLMESFQPYVGEGSLLPETQENVLRFYSKNGSNWGLAYVHKKGIRHHTMYQDISRSMLDHHNNQCD